MNRLMAMFVSFALVFALAPGTALAQEPAGSSPTYRSGALSVQAKGKLSNAAKKKMLTAYKKVLKQAQSGGVSYGGLGLGDSYAVYDMGADGRPELFVKTSDLSWGGQFHVFDFTSGKARYLGILPLSSGWLYGTESGKLYLLSGRQGAYSVSRVVKSSGKVACQYSEAKDFIAKDVDDWDNAWNRSNAYMQKLKATALETEPVASYSSLKGAIKSA